MLSFENDYNAGAHPLILKALADTNMVKQPGYGNDEYCLSAAEKIRAACSCPDAEVFFLTGGTQTNQVVISSLLRSYEGVLSAVSGHVNGHEAGAIEYSGHKVLILPQHEGKIDPAELEAWVKTFYADESHEHRVFPGMVYLSHPTEYGTLYSKAELETISALCRRYQIPLFMDGDRLVECIPDFRMRLKLNPRTNRLVFSADVNSVFDIAWYTLARLLSEDPAPENKGKKEKAEEGIMICCRHCGDFLVRRSNRQEYCDKPECQKARNAKNQRDFRRRKAIEKAQAAKNTKSGGSDNA